MSGDEAVSQIQVRCLSRPQFGPRISSGEQKPNHSVQPSFRNGRGLVFVRLSIILSLESSWVTCLCRKCVFIYNKPNYCYSYLLCTCFHCENERKLKSLCVSCINTLDLVSGNCQISPGSTFEEKVHSQFCSE